jgi:hypothetical protein
MNSPDPKFSALVDMSPDGVIRRILVQDTSGPRGWFSLTINLEAPDIKIYDGQADE